MSVCILALFIQHATRLHHIILRIMTCMAVPYSSILSHKLHDFGRRNNHKMCVMIYFTTWSEIFLTIKANQKDIVVNVQYIGLYGMYR